MGNYVTRTLTESEYREIVNMVRDGYSDHRPNPQVATILTLEANLGCRIGDILNLRTDSIINDGGIWKLNIVEQKTGKKRTFIVPKPIKEYIDKWIAYKGITTGKLFDISAQAVWKCLRIVTDYIGLENVSTHSFRKLASTRLYEATGHDIMAVCEFLQHSSPAITSAYLKRSSEQLEKAITNCVCL